MPIKMQKALQKALQKAGSHDRIIVGYSGGLDSTVLLHLVKQLFREERDSLLMAVHVNHQLSTAAGNWVRHCERQCRQWKVPFLCLPVDVEVGMGEGLEQAARTARYDAFRKVVGAGDLLLLAHHQSDQAETVLLRLVRGSGPLGLRGMEGNVEWAGFPVIRPLLSCSRTQLESYAAQHHLQWIEDDSNLNREIDRNFIRHEIMPRLRGRWTSVESSMARSSILAGEASELLDQLGEIDLQSLGGDGVVLDVEGLKTFSKSRLNNLLRCWIRKRGYPLPGRATLDRVGSELLVARSDGQPLVQWSGGEFRRFGGCLYLQELMESVSLPDSVLVGTSGDQFLGVGLGRLCFRQGRGVAISKQKSSRGDLCLKYRQGGELCRPLGGKKRPLKKLLQEYKVPPWLRDRWPLLYLGEKLIAVPGVFICDGMEASDVGDELWVDWEYA